MWLESAGCEELKIELSGVPLERPMSSSGLEQADDDDDDDDELLFLRRCAATLRLPRHV